MAASAFPVQDIWTDASESDRSPRKGEEPSSQGVLPDGTVTTEEFCRLQDEFVAQKMHNQALLEERRWLVQQQNAAQNAAPPPPPSPSGGFVLAAPGVMPLYADPASAAQASEAMRSVAKGLASQMKVGAGAMSALRARGVFSLQSTFAGTTTKKGPAEVMGEVAGGTIFPELLSREHLMANDRRELIAEAKNLRSRLDATLEEMGMMEALAHEAEQAAAAAAAAAEATSANPSPEVDSPPQTTPVPLADEIRGTAMSLCSSVQSAGEISDSVDDSVLVSIAEAVIRLMGRVPQSTEAPPAGDEDRILLQKKIQAQQQELDLHQEVFCKQQSQILELKSHIEECGQNKGVESNARKLVREKLRHTEMQVEGLARKLQSSEENSKETQGLRTQIKLGAEELRQRESVVAELRDCQQNIEQECALLNERTRLTQEDLVVAVSRRAATRSQRKVVVQVPPPPPPPPPPPLRGPVKFCGVEVQTDAYPTPEMLEERRRLEVELEDLGIRKSLIEKRAARELRELKSLAEMGREAPESQGRRSDHASQASHVPPDVKVQTVPSAADAVRSSPTLTASTVREGVPMAPAQSGGVPVEDSQESEARRVNAASLALERFVLHHDISSCDTEDEDSDEHSSDGEILEPYPAGLWYVQRVAELERQAEILRSRLAELHARESELREQNSERHAIIANLMERVGQAELDIDIEEGERGQWFTTTPEGSEPFWSRTQREQQTPEELQSMIESTTEDNIRLRNEIQSMSKELRRVLAFEGTSKVSEP